MSFFESLIYLNYFSYLYINLFIYILLNKKNLIKYLKTYSNNNSSIIINKE